MDPMEWVVINDTCSRTRVLAENVLPTSLRRASDLFRQTVDLDAIIQGFYTYEDRS